MKQDLICTVIGDGQMALVMADILSSGNNKVRLWGPLEQNSGILRRTRQDQARLPDFSLDQKIEIFEHPTAALEDSNLVISAIPTVYLRDLWGELGEMVPKDSLIVSTTKGVERKTMRRPTQILAESTDIKIENIAAISGPCIAKELARRLPSAAVIAGQDEENCRVIQEAFNTSWFRVYVNKDPVGTEFAGALKNIIAIAGGVLDALAYGLNIKGVLHARGLAEMLRFAAYFGADVSTFLGLAGVGDLVTTSHSAHSRNRTFGQKLGQGLSLEESLKQMTSVVEGVPTTRAVYTFATEKKIQMPITEAVWKLIEGEWTSQKAVEILMGRSLISEF